jgi:hypothetical protein
MHRNGVLLPLLVVLILSHPGTMLVLAKKGLDSCFDPRYIEKYKYSSIP